MKNRWVAVFLAIFPLTGMFGIHKIYIGHRMLFMFGIPFSLILITYGVALYDAWQFIVDEETFNRKFNA